MFTGIIKHTGKINKIYKNNNNCIIEILSKIKFSKNQNRMKKVGEVADAINYFDSKKNKNLYFLIKNRELVKL